MGRDVANVESPLVVMRLAVGLTQKQLANALNRSVQAVRSWEHGEVEPRLTIAETKLLCKLLKVPFSRLPDRLGPDSKEDRPGRSGRLKQLTFL